MALIPALIAALGLCLLAWICLRVTKRNGYSISIKGLGVSIEIKQKE